jgi:hypothetical protein
MLNVDLSGANIKHTKFAGYFCAHASRRDTTFARYVSTLPAVSAS